MSPTVLSFSLDRCSCLLTVAGLLTLVGRSPDRTFIVVLVHRPIGDAHPPDNYDHVVSTSRFLEREPFALLTKPSSSIVLDPHAATEPPSRPAQDSSLVVNLQTLAG
ncbi:hypothetical protein BGW80DRAFT_1282925 [Lactifluus volemus]|nr:hypothetical protein BGW80DRAFT_1282925 [Lactifluus volemus]